VREDREAVLQINVIMNSAVEEILAFKTCCGLKVFDQNLEIHVRNVGDRPVVVPSRFDLEGDYGVRHMEAVTPPGEHEIEPGELKAFYCTMDETLWNRSRRIVFFDKEGRSYPVDILQGSE
jgi:hypothetical protein